MPLPLGVGGLDLRLQADLHYPAATEIGVSGEKLFLLQHDQALFERRNLVAHAGGHLGVHQAALLRLLTLRVGREGVRRVDHGGLLARRRQEKLRVNAERTPEGSHVRAMRRAWDGLLLALAQGKEGCGPGRKRSCRCVILGVILGIEACQRRRRPRRRNRLRLLRPDVCSRRAGIVGGAALGGGVFLPRDMLRG